MNSINILVLSDIHLHKMEANDQGLVLNGLFKDLETQFPVSERENNWCIIAGDLVQAGIDALYKDFNEKFIDKLLRFVPKNQIIITPGNHDLNRNILSADKDIHNDLVALATENEINTKLKENQYIERKFKPFIQFSKSILNEGFNFDIRGFASDINSEITVFSLNSAILSTGGNSNFPEDSGNLVIDTSLLYEWIESTKGRKRILVMHHPVSFLKEIYQGELERIISQHIDMLIYGHVHDEDIHINIHPTEEDVEETIYMRCPQLFSSKDDLNGYCVTKIKEKNTEFVFRQWSQRRMAFQKGADFVNNDEGIFSYTSQADVIDDIIHNELESALNESLEIMGYIPTWEERILTQEWCSRNPKQKLIYYHDVLNETSKLLIAAPANHGLTCYGKYLMMRLWDLRQEHWLWLDMSNFKISQLDGKLGRLKNRRSINLSDIKGIIVDNWSFNNVSAQAFLEKINNNYPKKRLILLGHFDQISSIEGMACDDRLEDFKIFYLNDLPRKSMRSIVTDFTKEHKIKVNEAEDSSTILDRLTMDLDEINMFRSPTNCIHMLFAFKEDFNERPINRSRVFDKILKNLFKDSGLRYNDELIEDDCKLIMGALCFQLFQTGNHKFTESQLKNIVSTTYKTRYSNDDVDEILQVLCQNKIIVKYSDYYQFRAVFWEYYFTGFKMYQDEACYQTMLENKNYLIPDIMEFYSGSNPKCNEVIDYLDTKLELLLQSVQKGLGLKPFNPYPNFKWNLNEHILGKSKEELDSEIKASRLPVNVKDDILDANYDQTRPFNQSIQLVMEEYDVLNLMFLVKSASRVLRNSTLANEDKKLQLFSNILLGMREIANVLMYLSPLLAKNGYGGIGGANFHLTGDFPSDLEKCVHVIWRVIPFNIIMWFRNDIFSDRLSYMFRDVIKNSSSEPIIRHIAALLVADTRPQEWDKYIRNYIAEMDKNSYYLGDLKATLQHNYSIATLNQTDETKTRNLIKACIAKHKLGVKNPGKESISKIDDNKIPPRLV